jgi:coproporphyrinogen III oxidase-like Fe-S oxidoreductase
VLAALELQPEHISYYHLTLEPNTVFYSRPPPLPDTDEAWNIQDVGSHLLQDAGYANYEVSAWAKDGRQCAHNLNYWRFGDYLGLGAGAHGKLTDAAGKAVREARPANPRQYLRDASSAVALTAQSVIEQRDLVFEFMLNVLRLRAGFSLNDFEARTGLSASLLQPGLQEAVSKRLLLESEPGHFQPSERGWHFLDDLQSIFLPRV